MADWRFRIADCGAAVSLNTFMSLNPFTLFMEKRHHPHLIIKPHAQPAHPACSHSAIYRLYALPAK